jgi:hypothetical protein
VSLFSCIKFECLFNGKYVLVVALYIAQVLVVVTVILLLFSFSPYFYLISVFI